MSAQKPRPIRCARKANGKDERGQQDKEQTQAIDADEILGADRGNPGVAFDQLQAGGGRYRSFATASNAQIAVSSVESERDRAGVVPTRRR